MWLFVIIAAFLLAVGAVLVLRKVKK